MPRLSLGLPVVEAPAAGGPTSIPLEFEWDGRVLEIFVDVLYDSKRCTLENIAGGPNLLMGSWSIRDTSVPGYDTRMLMGFDMSRMPPETRSGTLCTLDFKTDGQPAPIPILPVMGRELRRQFDFTELVPGALQPIPGTGPGRRVRGSVSGQLSGSPI